MTHLMEEDWKTIPILLRSCHRTVPGQREEGGRGPSVCITLHIEGVGHPLPSSATANGLWLGGDGWILAPASHAAGAEGLQVPLQLTDWNRPALLVSCCAALPHSRRWTSFSSSSPHCPALRSPNTHAGEEQSSPQSVLPL